MLAQSETKNIFWCSDFCSIGRWFIGNLTTNQCSGLNYRANNKLKFKMSFNVDKNVGSIGDQKYCFGAMTFILVGNSHPGYLTPIHSCGLIYSANNTVKFKMSYNLDKNVGLIGRKKMVQ